MREKLARWICPDLAEKADRSDRILPVLTSFHYLFKDDIPEAAKMFDWVIGKEYPGYSSIYKASLDYPSLVKFRDILVNEYRRKMK